MNEMNIDQTEFSEEMLLSDQSESRVSKRSSTVTIVFVLIIFLLLIVILSLLLPKKTTQKIIKPGVVVATPVPALAVPTRLQKTIMDLNEAIKNSDPQNNDLPFPPVNFQLHLQTPKL